MLSDHGKLNWGSWLDSGSMISQKKKKEVQEHLSTYMLNSRFKGRR